ncbi:hypothetical protein [Streptomyces sp. ALI-76-A]|uniref:hypothetical protein n=1 Tax=Streptomyces sp. ALI-76-A TaxID=3025736 RepID=UPI00256F35C3|nr:hypothetical protein [Streptomyces sp. ALI-76-A]MDL5199205.1 hypothetical protein [Streptomyces sp. ALI-76-A]
MAADAVALAGVVLMMFLLEMSHSEPSENPSTTDQDVPLIPLVLVWFVPGALGLSSYVHARLRMPATSVVQGLFCVIGTALAIGATGKLLALG